MSKHQTFRTSHFGPKSNMSNITKNWTVREHQTVCSKTSLVTQQQDWTSNTSEHHILVQNQTSNMSNITKNRTIREHRTVRSKTNSYREVGRLGIYGLVTVDRHHFRSLLFGQNVDTIYQDSFAINIIDGVVKSVLPVVLSWVGIFTHLMIHCLEMR